MSVTPIHKRKRGGQKKPKIGDYVLLTRWPDADIHDPYVYGVLTDIDKTDRVDRPNRKTFYRCEEVSSRWLTNCRVITKEEGAEIARLTSDIATYGN